MPGHTQGDMLQGREAGTCCRDVKRGHVAGTSPSCDVIIMGQTQFVP